MQGDRHNDRQADRYSNCPENFAEHNFSVGLCWDKFLQRPNVVVLSRRGPASYYTAQEAEVLAVKLASWAKKAKES